MSKVKNIKMKLTDEELAIIEAYFEGLNTSKLTEVHSSLWGTIDSFEKSGDKVRKQMEKVAMDLEKAMA